jgi:hypothetical protein
MITSPLVEGDQGMLDACAPMSGLRLKRDPNGAYDLWQRCYRELWIRDDSHFSRHIAYIHYNPVKHGLALRPVVVVPADGYQWIGSSNSVNSASASSRERAVAAASTTARVRWGAKPSIKSYI